MRYIVRRKIALDNGEELDTGNQILMMFATPKLDANGTPNNGSDYEQQRAVRKALKYLRGDNRGVEYNCAIGLGEPIALEDAWYEHLMHQAKAWRWGMNDSGIGDMIEEWESASDNVPLSLVTNNKS